jgi:LuxR family transcriptional regulator, quorum-sensing system regulator BjaR1
VGAVVAQREVELMTLEFVSKLNTIEGSQAALPLFTDYADRLGFSNAICLSIPETGEDLRSSFLLNTYPSDWVRHYSEKDYLSVDPVVHELFVDYHPFKWSEIAARRELTPLERQVMDEGAEMGLREGFTVPIYQAGGYTGLVSLAGREPMITEESRGAITLASIYLHNKLTTLRRREVQNHYELTERELECLRWAAVGKSDWETGHILKISSKTVNYHIENAKRKFGVATRVQAIVCALRLGRLAA